LEIQKEFEMHEQNKRASMYVRMNECMNVCMYVCMYVWMNEW